MRTGKLVLISIGVSALLVFAWIRFPPQLVSPPASESGAGGPERAQIYYGPSNSLAVLPFTGEVENDQAFWSAGFSRELQQLATRTPGLQVTSGNSSFFFQDQSVPPLVIAERLKTRHLLSGEFLISDGRVLVNVILFDAKKRQDTWSGRFERDLGEVFAIQEEILTAVLETLGLGKRNKPPRARPVDTSAWMAYLQGIYFGAQRTPPELEKAEDAFLTALNIDPEYARAQVGLARLWLGRYAAGNGDVRLVEEARAALAAALSSEPELPATWGLLSYIQRNIDWDWQAGLESARQAIGLNPGDPDLMSTASLAMFSLGQFEPAAELLESSVRQDPLNLARRLRLGLLQEFSGELEKSLSVYRQIIGLNPDFPGVRAYRARVKLIQENPDSALRESGLETDPFWRRYSQILALSALDRHEEAEPLLEQMIAENGDDSAYQLAEIFAFRGEVDRAFDWFQRAYDQKDGGMSEIIGNWFLRGLHEDPRWEQMLQRLSLPLDGNG